MTKGFAPTELSVLKEGFYYKDLTPTELIQDQNYLSDFDKEMKIIIGKKIE